MLPRHGVTIAINTPGVALTTSITADTCCNVLMRLSQNRVRTREHHWDLATRHMHILCRVPTLR